MAAEMLRNGAPRPIRVVHFMDECFVATQTFVYDVVTGCAGVESWCVGWKVSNQDQMPFACVATLEGAARRNLRGLWERVFHRFTGESAMLRRTLTRLRPNVVHAHFGPNGSFVRNWCQQHGIPLITSFYGVDASALPQNPVWRRRFQELFAQGHAVVVEGPAMKARLVNLGCPPEKLRVIPIAIKPERYTFRPRVRTPGESLRLLFVARFTAKKGLPILIDALARARDDLGPWELRVIGDGPQADAIRKSIQTHGLDANIHLLGFRPRDVLVAEMANAHLLAVPSVTAPDGDSEGGAPTVLLEAQASGLPVVTTDHADIPFAVAPVYRPGLAREGEVESFADALRAAVRAAPSWPAWGNEGRRHVEAQHGPSNFRTLEVLYREAAGV